MNKKSKNNDLRAEYDFAAMPGGVRGKYARAYRAGTNIAVLADDVASAFPTDESVNRALRAILDAAASIPKSRTAPKALRRTSAKRGGPVTPRQRRSSR